MPTADAELLRGLLRDVPDFPQPGVLFKDITPLLADPVGLPTAVSALASAWADVAVDKVAAIEARGFIFAAPLAVELGVGLVPLRKPGKLPWDVVEHEYDLEYGTDRVAAHRDAVRPGERVLVVDDVLATGGTAAAACTLVEQLDGVVAGVAVLLELGFLHGRARLEGHDVRALLVEP